jgi:tetratricopeptide (TPR) repeat protein
MTHFSTELTPENQNAYDELVTVIAASQGGLAILIAVCDDRLFRAQIIQRYEAELSPDIFPVRLDLNRREPSLRAAIDQWLMENPWAEAESRPLVLTMTGAEELLWLNLQEGDELTQLDKFYGYLQWTREGLREFPYPIVLWVTRRILQNLSRRSPDFWSWRRGVYRFVAPASTATPQIPRFDTALPIPDSEPDEDFALPLADLLALIGKTEAKSGTETAGLATLYKQLGQVYAKRVNNGEAEDLAWERIQAIASFRKAIELQEQFSLTLDRMESLLELGNFYLSQSNYPSAIEYYQQSLEIACEASNTPEEKRRKCQGESNALGNLGNVYNFLGQYQQAIEFHQQSLDIQREISDSPQERRHQRHGEGISMGNLGIAYYSLGQYQQAIEFYQQSLDIQREIGDRKGESSALCNLGNAYFSLNQYQLAINFYQQYYDIAREVGDRQGEANALGNLGNVYGSLGQYQQAIDFHQQSLDIKREIGDRKGESNALGNLGLAYSFLRQYQRAIDLQQQSLDIAREIGDRNGEGSSLFNMGLTFANIDEHDKALQNYQQALTIYEDLQLDHMIEKCKTAIAELNKI